MKTLLVVKFDNPIIFSVESSSGRKWCSWDIGLLAGERFSSITEDTRRGVIYWDYHKRPNLGWWKGIKEKEFGRVATVIGPEVSYSHVIAEWNVPDELYDEITSWCIDRVTTIYGELFSRKINNPL